MGNKQSTASGDGTEEGWLVVDIHPEDALSFNPESSYVLCTGIGEQDGLEKKTNLGPAADRDAIGVAKLFDRTFHVPDDQIIILTSKTKPATDRLIISALKHQAHKVKDDGILIFQFSGHVHRIEKKNTVVFIPANFDGSAKTVLTIPKLLRAIKGTKAKYVIMIMDCCYAGGVAEELVVSIPDDVPTYVLASCSSTQKSLSFNELGNGFFTYFFLKYFDSYHDSKFPLKDVVSFCKPLCDAINKLLRPGFDHDACMSPQMLWNTYKIKTMEVKKEVFDETDAVEEDPLRYARRYHQQFSVQDSDIDSPWKKSEVPDHVMAWLHVEAYESLKYLHDMKILKKSEGGLFSTITAFVAQSTASLGYRELKKSNISSLLTIFRASAVMEAYINFAEILYKSINYTLVPDILDLRLYIEYYAYKIKTLANIDYDHPEMVDIVLLLTAVLDDIKKQKKPIQLGGRMRKAFDETDGGGDEADGGGDEVVTTEEEMVDTGDEADGGGDEVVTTEEEMVDTGDIQKLGAYLDNLPLANAFIELPKIEDEEDAEEPSDLDEEWDETLSTAKSDVQPSSAI